MSIQQKAHSSFSSFAYGHFFSVVASKKLKLKNEVSNPPRARMNPRRVGNRSFLMMLWRSTEPNMEK